MWTRVVVGVGILLCIGVSSVWADFDKLQTCGTEEITVSTVAKSLAPITTCSVSRVQQVTKAICSTAGADLRMRIDGTDPTTDVGHVIADGSYIYLNNPGEVTNARFIRDGSTDVELTCSYRRIGG